MKQPWHGSFKWINQPCILLVFLFIFSLPIHSQDLNPDDETCLACHDELDVTLAGTPHRLSSTVNKPTAKIGCVSCHAGGEQHADDPSVENITNPARLSDHDAREVCSNCHTSHRQLDNFGFDTHSELDLNCSSCHVVHGSSKFLLLDDKAEFCQKCHIEVVTKFHRRSNHPVLQGNLTCLSCHQFNKRQDANLLYDLSRTCQDCHPQHAGPFLYEHETVNGYSTEDGGCVECHDPHGSENDHLLKQSEVEQCRQCHIGHVTRNHNQLWDAVWSNLACQTCHIDTHGSFVSNLYLDPDLPTKFGGDCYETGCHSVNR